MRSAPDAILSLSKNKYGICKVTVAYFNTAKRVMDKEQNGHGSMEDGELSNSNNGDHEDTAREQLIDEPMHDASKAKEEQDNPPHRTL